ncbi:heptaprenyl diphosphate synthase component 1 [Ectobacillus ponti]|uniref:Heptaprenyl diphosphate synthase component 1 n=1 Tax=Ectobacillus ponti TaxID=2961894 RepID=A0AA41X9H0_9BACI|nr:heptaprenyl diphosphate synthase component 1 [Ectobacillus ponti]
MKHIYEDVTAIKEQLYNRLRHPYLMQYIDEPFVDDEKLLLLYSILKSARLPAAALQHYAVTIMLVQIALDTHEKVSNKGTEEGGRSHKYRQLTALAGDYYSGLYYYLLAQKSDISLIRVLAKGIEEVNEGKIVLHQQGGSDLRTLLGNVAVVESALLQKTCEHFNVPVWKPFVSSFLKMTRLQREYQCYQRGEESPVFRAFLHAEPEKNPFSLYEAHLRQEQEKLQQWAAAHPDSELAARLLENLLMKL